MGYIRNKQAFRIVHLAHKPNARSSLATLRIQPSVSCSHANTVWPGLEKAALHGLRLVDISDVSIGLIIRRIEIKQTLEVAWLVVIFQDISLRSSKSEENKKREDGLKIEPK